MFSCKDFSFFLAQKHHESLLYWLLLKSFFCLSDGCPSHFSVLLYLTLLPLCVSVLYGVGARSSIRKTPSQPLWLTSCTEFHNMKTRSQRASGTLWRTRLPVWATSQRAWRIWRWTRQIRVVAEEDAKRQTAAREKEKKWTRTFLNSHTSSVQGPATAPPA